MPYCRQCGVPLAKNQKVCVQCGTVVVDDFQPKRHWELHPGSNSFFCDGRFVTSRELWIASLTWLINIAVPTLYFVFDADYIWHHISPAIVIIAAVLIVLTLLLLFRVSTTDPGIIPRGEQEEIREPNGIVNQFKLITVRGQEHRLKYCYTCKMYRPPRSSHCRQCDNCVEGFDHHCPWVGNCIGARNYRYFYFYVLLETISCLFYLGSSLAHLILEILDKGAGSGFRDNIGTVVVCCVVSFFVFQLLILLTMHTRLVAENMTTNEEIRRGVDRNVYDEGCCVNMLMILCGPRMPSRLLAREPLVNGRPRNRPLIGAEPPVPLQAPLEDMRNLLDPDSARAASGSAVTAITAGAGGAGSMRARTEQGLEMQPLPPVDSGLSLPPLPNMEHMPLSVSPKLPRADRSKPYLDDSQDHVLPDYGETSFANASHTALPLPTNGFTTVGGSGGLTPGSVSPQPPASPLPTANGHANKYAVTKADGNMYSFTIDADATRRYEDDSVVTADGIITCV